MRGSGAGSSTPPCGRRKRHCGACRLRKRLRKRSGRPHTRGRAASAPPLRHARPIFAHRAHARRFPISRPRRAYGARSARRQREDLPRSPPNARACVLCAAAADPPHIRPRQRAGCVIGTPPPALRAPSSNAGALRAGRGRLRRARPRARVRTVLHLEDAPRGRPRRDVGVILVAEHDLNTRQG